MINSCACGVAGEEKPVNHFTGAKTAHKDKQIEIVEDERSLEEQIWEYLVNQYENEYAAAALMGNADFESALCPYRTEGDKVIDEDGIYTFSKEYTRQVDENEIDRETFAYAGPKGGAYGLFAWTSAGRKEGLYDLAKERNVSISDWRMQLDYAYNEIVERYYDLYYALITAESIQEATEAFGINFEQAENIGYTVIRRTEIAQEYFDKYGSSSFTPKYTKGEIIPVNNSYDYLNYEFEQDIKNTNIYVYIAQIVLNYKGYLNSEPCGYYGDEMAESIMKIQEDYKIEPDGALDQEVWQLLDSCC